MNKYMKKFPTNVEDGRGGVAHGLVLGLGLRLEEDFGGRREGLSHGLRAAAKQVPHRPYAAFREVGVR